MLKHLLDLTVVQLSKLYQGMHTDCPLQADVQCIRSPSDLQSSASLCPMTQHTLGEMHELPRITVTLW